MLHISQYKIIGVHDCTCTCTYTITHVHVYVYIYMYGTTLGGSTCTCRLGFRIVV